MVEENDELTGERKEMTNEGKRYKKRQNSNQQEKPTVNL